MMQALSTLYEDTCTVTEVQKVKDPITHITKTEQVIVLDNQPCRLSYKTVQTTKDGMAAENIQQIKLFVAPGIEIKPGSKVSVTRQGVSTTYESSGEIARYATHNEIILKLQEYA